MWRWRAVMARLVRFNGTACSTGATLGDINPGVGLRIFRPPRRSLPIAHCLLLTLTFLCYTRAQKWLKMQPCALLFRTIPRALRVLNAAVESPLQISWRMKWDFGLG